ncbi:fibrinogen-like protein 1-like protein [Rana temporaria]|uniref:fibrinogen-like protein 1-like protein n=1 Tax=Rana temporaria TaxID=8407 RepID=UPI001AAD6256|nr:fibrinogen-like protein 1-like protein [Rana temporaria]XP_040211573.1 fibrinogen-like protein 1-like protein [Rana temporaria]
MSGPNLWTVVWFFLLWATFTNAEEAQQVTKGKLVDNIHMVKDITDAINYNELRQKKVFFTRDCEELYQLGHKKSGVYVIRPEGSPYLVVQCLMYDCGGWTVIQRNAFDTTISWHETWSAYEFGFGDIELNHYLGNKYIHLLTTQKWNKVRFLLVDAENNTKHADYDSFYLTDAGDKYRLRLGTYEGDAGDSMTSIEKNLHDNMRFSTYDDDNDRRHNNNCANEHGGGWWYDSCYDAQLNVKNGLHWKTLCQHNCRHSLILIRPVHMYCNRV